jgi:hypothetical protein
MTMAALSDSGALLHNMSTPSKSMVKYAGLGKLEPIAGRPRPTAGSVSGIYGTPVRFILPVALKTKTPAFILQHLGIEPIGDGQKQLIALIDARARELTLPDGCAVIPALTAHPILWSDTLSALAVLCKCSDSIWLRSKTTALSTGLQHKQVTLLVPPMFANRLPKEPNE